MTPPSTTSANPSPTDGHWRLADRLFDAALDLPPAERPSYLARACGGDHELRSLVERLLDGAETAEQEIRTGMAPEPFWRGFLEEGDESGLDGREVGHYRIVRLLGRGGMATVYLAERPAGGGPVPQIGRAHV